MKRSATKPAPIEAAAADWIARRDAGLTPAEEAELTRWREADPRHDQALARQLQAWSFLDRPLQGGQANAMVRTLKLRAQTRRRRQIGAAAACFVVLLTLAILWRRPSGPTPKAGAVATATATVIEPEKRTLPDGSLVELNTGAIVDVRFDGATRRVFLRKGEAHFEVVKDPARPFVVAAEGIEFKAVGTAFCVDLGASKVELLVTEGRVAVQKNAAALPDQPAPEPAPGGAAPEPATLVTAGNLLQVELAPAAAPSAWSPVAVPADEIARRLGWRTARLEFTATPLAEAVAAMNRHNRVQFVITDPSLAKVEVSGLFRADNTDAFLLLLEGSLGVKAERSGDTVRLSRGPGR
ncbi:FecR domain-containing protein [Opitutus sp. ER46]|uniref:FecR family protein n=1 Tax=Opitutus sp. ER46 TaxID=2161864 RepID=UPI000D309688|nr:FecR domain-containing protein [Opitutus sp. ER46]PTX92305.1 hypothetical protein DB354_13250 [Opitutus sp. ER46]